MTEERLEKASLSQMEALHGLVANQLASNLDDPKVIAMAIKFLKDNNITADVMESESMMSLTDSIKKIANDDSEEADMLSIEELLGSS